MQVIQIQTQPMPQQRYSFQANKFQPNFQKPPPNFFQNQQFRQNIPQGQASEFDGKRLRKAVARKTVDYNSAIIEYLEQRIWQRDFRDRRAIQPDSGYYTRLQPPLAMLDNPINSVTTKFVRTSTNKMRCPIFCVVWTPEGRRLVTGASSGEFTLWNGLTFNFETILQAHDSSVRCMVWSHSDTWMVTGDHTGYVKYWQSNMNNVKMFQAHKEAVRGISFCPTDGKFTTCSDDGTVRIWDFMRCFEEKILRGHGADVKCVDWHPQKGLIVSGSKDSQQPIKLWDPKSGQSLATIHAHKSTVMDLKWNKNGNWLLTASRDHLLKIFDIRKMNQELQTFRGHKKEACSLAWHPVHETLFASGGSDGAIMFWLVGADKEVGSMEQAHESCVWSLAWHPLGHILCSGSNDHTSKFWTRNRPGDRMRDKYNLNTLPKGLDDTGEYDEPTTTPAAIASDIPGMGLEHGTFDIVRGMNEQNEEEPHMTLPDELLIPGLDFGGEESPADKPQKRTPFSKPIPKQFQQQWMENKQPLLLAPPNDLPPPGEIPPGAQMIPIPGMPQPQPGQPPMQMPNNFPPGMMGPPPPGMFPFGDQPPQEFPGGPPVMQPPGGPSGLPPNAQAPPQGQKGPPPPGPQGQQTPGPQGPPVSGPPTNLAGPQPPPNMPPENDSGSKNHSEFMPPPRNVPMKNNESGGEWRSYGESENNWNEDGFQRNMPPRGQSPGQQQFRHDNNMRMEMQENEQRYNQGGRRTPQNWRGENNRGYQYSQENMNSGDMGPSGEMNNPEAGWFQDVNVEGFPNEHEGGGWNDGMEDDDGRRSRNNMGGPREKMPRGGRGWNPRSRGPSRGRGPRGGRGNRGRGRGGRRH